MSAPRDRATIRLVLGDQLTRSLSSLSDLGPHDVVLLAEVMGECTYVRHHAKKIVLVLAGMRHFAAGLRAEGITVDHIALDAPGNTGTLQGEVARAVARHGAEAVVVTEPGEYRLLADMRTWHERLGATVDIRDDGRFLCSIRAFRDWAAGKKQTRMEFFYRDMRRQYGVLLDAAGGPEGGSWNYDAENRKALPAKHVLPVPHRYQPDGVTRAVMELVAATFPNHFGSVEGFGLPVTRADALHALDEFVALRLPRFGDWQDAMKTDEPTLYHALLSTSLNLGLLTPLEICQRAEAAYRAGEVPLNSAEGFIRQILGWREFIRGIYWLKMPEYAALNALEATRPLPSFYWSGDTKMRCLHQAIGQTRENAYAHHIQRLMVTGNFALIAGLHPDDVGEWYLIVYADAYEWVEMPNVRGMALHADGGIVGSKPYASSGAYINRMSDYCRGCHYDVRDAVGERACPFNFLYWDFIARHEQRFAGNNRMQIPVANWHRMEPARREAIRAKAAGFLAAMEGGAEV